MSEDSQKTAKTAATGADNGEEEEDNYELPEDVVFDVKPCKYLSEIYQEPVILFDEMGNRIPEFIKIVKYSEIPKFMDIPITDSYKMFVQAFNDVRREQIASPPQNVADYANYLSGLIPQKACFQLSSTWSVPSIPRVVNTMEPMAAILIKMLNECADPTNLLRFLSVAIFPKVWTSKPCTRNTRLLAISACKFKGKEGHWAYIVRETNEFTLVGQNPKTGEVIVKAEGVAIRCVKSKDKESVIVKGATGRITDFTPYDTDTIALWTHIFKVQEQDADDDSDNEQKDIPFPYYLTKSESFFPDPLYGAFYEGLVANDLIFMRALIKIDPPYYVVKSFLTIILYSRKCHQFYSAVVGNILEPFEINPMAIHAADSFYRKFVHALWERFGEPYINQFLKKIVALIDKHTSFDERLYFTVVKYIQKSSQYIPPSIRHFASIIRSYSATKFNSRGMTYILLGGFFGLDFICPVLAHPEKYMKTLNNRPAPEDAELQLVHPHVCKQVSENLQFLFHGSLLPDRYQAMNNRMRKHTIPEMEEFLFSIGDLQVDVFVPTPPSAEDFVPALEHIMRAFYKKPAVLRTVYDEAQIPQPSYPPQIGWNFTASLSDFFRQYHDRGQKHQKVTTAKKVKPTALKFPTLPIYGVMQAKKSPQAPLGFDDSNSVVSRGLIPPPMPPTFSMRLPQRPKNTKHNPLDKPEPPAITDSESTLSH